MPAASFTPYDPILSCLDLLIMITIRRLLKTYLQNKHNTVKKGEYGIIRERRVPLGSKGNVVSFSKLLIDVVDKYLERLDIVRRRVILAQEFDDIKNDFDAIACPNAI